MCEPGESVPSTLKREFFEEATNSLEKSAEENQAKEEVLKSFFENGKKVRKKFCW